MTPCPAGQTAGDNYACVACAPGKYKLIATEEIPDLHPCFHCLTTGEWSSAGTHSEKCSLQGLYNVLTLRIFAKAPRAAHATLATKASRGARPMARAHRAPPASSRTSLATVTASHVRPTLRATLASLLTSARAHVTGTYVYIYVHVFFFMYGILYACI